jgi:hypothetical protein
MPYDFSPMKNKDHTGNKKNANSAQTEATSVPIIIARHEKFYSP